MVAPAAAAGIAAGVEIVQMILKIASSDDGVAWLGRKMKDKLPALRARIRANKHVKVGGKEV